MATYDLNSLSLDELKKLQKDVAKAIAEFADRKKVEALKAVEALAKEMGFGLSELTGAKPRRGAAQASPAKYRHPENPSITWTGRGRRPEWFTAAIEAGRSAEDLSV